MAAKSLRLQLKWAAGWGQYHLACADASIEFVQVAMRSAPRSPPALARNAQERGLHETAPARRGRTPAGAGRSVGILLVRCRCVRPIDRVHSEKNVTKLRYDVTLSL